MADHVPVDRDGGEGPSEIVVACACGWTTQGPVDRVVAETQEHGRQLHNMAATREDVLAMARPATP